MSEELVCLEELGVKGEVAKILKQKGISNLGCLREHSQQSLAEQGLSTDHINQVNNALRQYGWSLASV